MRLDDLKDFWLIYRQNLRLVIAGIVLLLLMLLFFWLLFFADWSDDQGNNGAGQLGDEIIAEENGRFLIPESFSDFSWQFRDVSLFDGYPLESDFVSFRQNYEGDLFSWNSKLRRFYYLGKVDGDLTQSLLMFDLDSGESEVVARFPRDIEEALIAVSPEGGQSAIIELRGEQDFLYLINGGDGGKRRVDLGNQVVNFKWLDERWLLLEELDDDGEFQLKVIDQGNGAVLILPILANMENVVAAGEDLIFIQGRDDLLEGSNSDVEIRSFNLESGSSEVIIDVTNQIEGYPRKISLSEDGQTLRILSQGLVYDLKFR